MTAELAKATEYLHSHIPMTAHMGVEVVAWDGETVRLSAPLAPNLNHRETAFGGSIAGLGIISGWTLLHLKLREAGYHRRLVVFRSQTEFTAPIEDTFEAVTRLADPGMWPKLIRGLDRKGIGRATVTTEIVCGTAVAATQEATYVATGPAGPSTETSVA